jgi:hypothetical protein
MNLVPVGPWYVVQSLTRCVETGKTHLSLRGSIAHWVGAGEKWQAWSGTEQEARENASLYGGEAIPAKYIDPRSQPRECPHKPNPHKHDRTGEEHAA